MRVGPILRRELITSVRSSRIDSDRRAALLLAATAVGGCFGVYDWKGWDRATVAGASRFGLAIFAVLIAALAGLAAVLVMGPISAAIASERDRKTLDALLATRLSGAQIVLGTVAAGLVRYGCGAAAMLPVVVLVVAFGGVDVRLALLAGAGLVSMASAMAALAVAISVGSRGVARAASVTAGWYTLWMALPMVFLLARPRIWPGSPGWVVAVAVSLLDGSPLGLLTNLIGLIPRPGGLPGALIRLIGWQVGFGALLTAWAIVRLRPASRAVYNREGLLSKVRLQRASLRRPVPRSACGDDPILWNEMYQYRGSSRVGRLWGILVGLVAVGLVAVATSWFALPAFAELAGRGYGATPEAARMPDLNPVARVLIARLIITSPLGPAPGQARLEFNLALRQFSALLVMMSCLRIFVAGGMSLVNERRRDTWLGLIATPLTGREILGAKMLGASLSVGGTGLVLVGLWVVGLVAGALHPIGFLAALAWSAISGWFVASVGVHTGLYPAGIHEPGDPSRWPVDLLAGLVGILMGAVVMPCLAWSSLFSYEDIRAAIDAGPFPEFEGTTLARSIGARTVVAAWLVGTTALAVAARRLTRSLGRGFDAAVGRPTRPDSPLTTGGDPEPTSVLGG